jgi:Ran GTPase-activating protein (RanGAP) involved in mRNA processing and transport
MKNLLFVGLFVLLSSSLYADGLQLDQQCTGSTIYFSDSNRSKLNDRDRDSDGQNIKDCAVNLVLNTIPTFGEWRLLARKFPNIRSITASNLKMDADNVGDMAKTFREFIFLRSINLSNNSLETEGAEIIANAITQKALRRLSKLDLSGNKLENRGVYAVLKALEEAKLPYLKELNLMDNNLISSVYRDGLSPAIMLAISDEYFANLTTFKLGYNDVRGSKVSPGTEEKARSQGGIGYEFKRLIQDVNNGGFNNITHLGLKLSNIMTDDMQLLVDSINAGKLDNLSEFGIKYSDLRGSTMTLLADTIHSGHLKNLIAISFDDNQVVTAAMLEFFDAIKGSNFENLENLYFYGLKLNDAGFEAFVDLINDGEFPKLAKISMLFAEVNAANMAAFAGATKNLKNLIELSFIRSRVEDDGLTALATGDFPTLKKLNLLGNRFGDVGVAALATGNFPELEVLQLWDNDAIGDAGAQAMANAMTRGKFPKLYDLNLAGCSIDEDGAMALVEVIKSGKVPHLKKVDLYDNYRISESSLAKVARALRANASAQSNRVTATVNEARVVPDVEEVVEQSLSRRDRVRNRAGAKSTERRSGPAYMKKRGGQRVPKLVDQQADGQQDKKLDRKQAAREQRRLNAANRAKTTNPRHNMRRGKKAE